MAANLTPTGRALDIEPTALIGHPATCASTSEQNQRLLLPDILSAP
jgi:hypothetical protein